MLPLLATLLGSLALPIAQAAAAPTDWKIAVGWNQTVLPASAIGTPVGPFTAPSTGSSNVLVSLAASTTSGTPGGTFVCQDTDWGGVCGYAVQPLNECILLQAPWLKTISSFGPDAGANCFAYASGNCDDGDAQWSFEFPGDDTGGIATTNPWNDQITSFACVPS
ncbi:hypothetical protein HMN09_00348600 [Mycena chlorophos]|uniref:Uncharacterized protein n=1 Tax=Mycena chlorophos TaxID=658473 RepID=A0A8H6TJN5_MYCCL|nr:hypothetical protein HMN09_00348600 [Mycena chlorophos]